MRIAQKDEIDRLLRRLDQTAALASLAADSDEIGAGVDDAFWASSTRCKRSPARCAT